MVRPHYFAEIIHSLHLVQGGQLLVTGELGMRGFRKFCQSGANFANFF